MPRKTQGYEFEWKILEFAGEFSERLFGGHFPFVMVFNSGGVLRSLYFEPPFSSWRDLTVKLKESGEPHFFYDPFDAPEWTWVSWFGLEQTTMERLIGRPFDESDFTKDRAAANVVPELDSRGVFPNSWGVMF